MAINLAPGTQYIIEARKRRQRLYAYSIAMVVVVGGVWAALGLYEASKNKELEEVKASIRNVDAEIAKSQSSVDEIKSFEQRLSDLDVLLNNHVSWDKVFTELERLMPPDTVITNIDGDKENGVLIVRGETPDIDKIAITLASIKNTANHNTLFSGAKFGSSQREESNVEGSPDKAVKYRFDAEFMFNPEVLFVNQ